MTSATGTAAKPDPANEPALRPSDLDCEATFADYCDAHQYVDREKTRGYLGRDAFESGFRRRQAWLAARRGVSAGEVNDALRASVAAYLAERSDAPPAAAWAFASKVAVAIEACVGPAPVVAPQARQPAHVRADRRARAIADTASRFLARKAAALWPTFPT